MKTPLYLDGKWELIGDETNLGMQSSWFIPEIYSNLAQNGAKIYDLDVPSNFNVIPDLFHYAGVVWYKRDFRLTDFNLNQLLFLKCEGINYIADIWLNGQFVGHHEGGFLPFEFKILNSWLSVDHSNTIIIRVDSGVKKDGVPGESCDWLNWGGIHRHIYLYQASPYRLESIHIISQFADPNPIKAEINVSFKIRNLEKLLEQIQNKGGNHKELHFTYQISEANRFKLVQKENSQVIVEDSILFEELTVPKLNYPYYFETNHFRSFSVEINSPKLWHPSHPSLYQLSLRINSPNRMLNSLLQDIEITQTFGIRIIQTQGSNVELNHKPFKMQGVSLHEEQEPFGRHYSVDMRRKELLHMKHLGFNALRSAHYTHDEILCILCDEIGLILLEEIPVYWNIQFSNRKTMKLAFRMVYDMIQRDYNHPSVILWSVGNEVPVENRDCRQAMMVLMNWARKLDPSRLVTYTSCRMTSDLLRRRSDISAVNFYFGWYYLSVKNLSLFLDLLYYSTNPFAPLLLTEFGAGAKYGVHDLSEKFSEEAQARTISHQIQTLNAKPYVAGWFIWIYRDFRSSQRLNKFQQGFNRKGIVSERNEEKIIAKIMPRLVRKIDSHVKNRHLLAAIGGKMLQLVELIVVKLLFMQEYKKERKLVDNYYHLDPNQRVLQQDTI